MFPTPTRLRATLFLLAMAACGGANRPRPAPLSAVDHVAQARREESEARAHDARAVDARVAEASLGGQPACLDSTALVPAPQSGGEELTVMRPCFVTHQRSSALEAEAAARHRATARSHRAHATALVEAEATRCEGIGLEEREHSPFAHVDDIRAVEPLLVDGRVRGARVWFRKVPGLTVAWMRRDIECHLARAAAMGYSTSEMPYCPLMLEGVKAEVFERPEGILVVLRADRAESAQAVLGRAEDLLLPKTE